MWDVMYFNFRVIVFKDRFLVVFFISIIFMQLSVALKQGSIGIFENLFS